MSDPNGGAEQEPEYVEPRVYVWDDEEKLCYALSAFYFTSSKQWYQNYVHTCTVLGPVSPWAGRTGTQHDLEAACRANAWWNPSWPYPPLGEDPIPF